MKGDTQSTRGPKFFFTFRKKTASEDSHALCRAILVIIACKTVMEYLFLQLSHGVTKMLWVNF